MIIIGFNNKLKIILILASAYIGCRHYNGKWQWTTSGKELLLTDTLWTPDEPRELGCVQIWKGNKLDDTPCFNLIYFLCEKVSLFTISSSCFFFILTLHT